MYGDPLFLLGCLMLCFKEAVFAFLQCKKLFDFFV